MDFQTENRPGGGDTQDTRWRYSAHGEGSARSGQLDAAKFIAASLVINGRVPSGTPLAFDAASKLYVPLTAVTGSDVLAGFVNDNVGVAVASAASKPTCAVLVHGIIKASALPSGAALVKDADTTGTFTFTED